MFMGHSSDEVRTNFEKAIVERKKVRLCFETGVDRATITCTPLRTTEKEVVVVEKEQEKSYPFGEIHCLWIE